MRTKLSRRKINTYAAIISVALIGVYMLGLGFGGSRGNFDTGVGKLSRQADRSASGLHILQFDPHGNISHELRSPQADYFENQQPNSNSPAENEDFSAIFEPETTETVTQLQQPQMTFYSDQGSTHLSADLALLFDTQQVELKDNVHVFESAGQHLLTTDNLRIDMSLKQIFTEQPLTITNPNSYTTATGLQGNLSDRRWQLLSEVRSEFIPQ
jgi:lipopolysaccharide export system protein LptC